MLFRLIICLVLSVAALAGAASAQQQQKEDDPMQLLDQAHKKEAADIDRQYKATLQKTNKATAPAPVDPWSNFRTPAGDKQH